MSGDNPSLRCYPLEASMSPALRSILLERAGFRHAFFTRLGGVSKPPWDTLNFSSATGDDPQAVRVNLQRAGRELGVRPERIYFLKQVHGCHHRVLTGRESPAEVQRVDGDVVLSRVPALACAVRTADCPAVLIADRHSGAVAAIHSGWRGTVRGVVAAGVAALRGLTDGPLELTAAVGPHIESCCFEVGEDVAEQLASASELGDEVVEWSGKKPHVDLRRVITAQLQRSGVAAEAIDQVRGCTVCEPERFHSYRRDGKRGGRMLAAIVARGDSEAGQQGTPHS